MNKKQKKTILKKYLGLSPAWFDLRKKAILRDNIDIHQWQINMNYLIYKYGTIDSSEQRAFEEWRYHSEKENDEFDFEEYLEERITPVLLHIPDGTLPEILYRNKDRNWFLAAYPDVFAYFIPQDNYSVDSIDDFKKEMRRVDEHVRRTQEVFERMEQYVVTGIGNQTIYLIRMKNFYKKEIVNKFLLS